MSNIIKDFVDFRVVSDSQRKVVYIFHLCDEYKKSDEKKWRFCQSEPDFVNLDTCICRKCGIRPNVEAVEYAKELDSLFKQSNHENSQEKV